jgi:hypothetical protein
VKVCTPTLVLCKNKHRRDAACRRLLRCTQCGKVMQAWERVGRCQSCRIERDDDQADAVAREGGGK